MLSLVAAVEEGVEEEGAFCDADRLACFFKCRSEARLGMWYLVVMRVYVLRRGSQLRVVGGRWDGRAGVDYS